MKKTIIGFILIIVCSTMLMSIDKTVLSFVGKIINWKGNIVAVEKIKNGDTDYDARTIYMSIKSIETGKIDIINITNLEMYMQTVEILGNNLNDYYAKQEKLKQQKKAQVIEKEKLRIEQIKEQERLKIEGNKFIENAKINAKGNPFALFMGMPWKMNAVDFKNYFKYDLIPFSQGFATGNFPLGNINIETMAFVFNSQDKNLKFNKSNYSKFYFNQVFMTIEPAQFETLVYVFTKKYGKPFEVKEYDIQNRMGAKFNQKEVYWKNGDRKIKLSRYTETVDKGRVAFSSIEDENKLQKEKEKESKEAADIL